MKNFKKIFILGLIIIFLLFVTDRYTSAQIYKLDTNTYVTLTSGEGFIKTASGNILKLEINNKTLLNQNDEITTLKNSFAIIKWGDNSLTRLSENSKIKILEKEVNNDLSKINIKFNILKGLSWSNIISIMGDDSYFKAEIGGVEASVRGTTFLLDVDKQNIYVYKHQVKLNYPDGTNKNVNQGKWENIKTKKEILENEIIKNYNKFINDNLKKDLKYINDLTKESLNRIKKETNMVSSIIAKFSKEKDAYIKIITGEKDLSEVIGGLDKKEQEYLKSKLNQTLQTLNFEKGLNDTIFNIKQNLKKELITSNLIDENYKEQLVKYSLYDLSDLRILDPNNKNLEKLYLNTKEILKNINTDKLKNDLINNTEVLKNLEGFELGLDKIFENININLKDNLENINSQIMDVDNNIRKNLQDLGNQIDKNIKDSLNKTFNN